MADGDEDARGVGVEEETGREGSEGGGKRRAQWEEDTTRKASDREEEEAWRIGLGTMGMWSDWWC